MKNPPAMWETWIQLLGWEDPWRRAWLPTPVFLLGESHGQRSLAGYSPRGRKVSDKTERLSAQPSSPCYICTTSSLSTPLLMDT